MTVHPLYRASALVLVASLLTIGCDSPDSTPETPEQFEPEVVEPETATPDPHWVESRVDDARERLTDSEAGQKLWNAIEGHGGLRAYYEAGPVHFRFNYAPHEGDARDTYNVVDTWSSSVVQWPADHEEHRFGWTNESAWEMESDEELGYNARFWSLTPYYFLAIPFVLADPGVNLEDLGEATLDEEEYFVIKATFDPGTGDAPDDYYVLYIHQHDDRVDAIRYVVAYPGFFPDGGHSNETFMTYEEHQEVDSLLFATYHRSFRSEEEVFEERFYHEGEKAEHITTTRVSEIGFRPEKTLDFFAPPHSARVIDGWE